MKPGTSFPLTLPSDDGPDEERAVFWIRNLTEPEIRQLMEIGRLVEKGRMDQLDAARRSLGILLDRVDNLTIGDDGEKFVVERDERGALSVQSFEVLFPISGELQEEALAAQRTQSYDRKNY